MMPRIPIFLILFSITLCSLSMGCAASPAPQVSTLTRAEPVPFPERPAFVSLQNGDMACMSTPARERLAQQHVQVVLYLKNLEAALTAYDAQAGFAQQVGPPAPKQEEAR